MTILPSHIHPHIEILTNFSLYLYICITFTLYKIPKHTSQCWSHHDSFFLYERKIYLRVLLKILKNPSCFFHTLCPLLQRTHQLFILTSAAAAARPTAALVECLQFVTHALTCTYKICSSMGEKRAIVDLAFVECRRVVSPYKYFMSYLV